MDKAQQISLTQFDDSKDLPIQYQDRKGCTDYFCLIFGIAFTTIMLLIAILSYNGDTYVKVNFPTDSEGNICGITYPEYPYVYFAQPPKIARRVCVSQCPRNGDQKLQCTSTKDVGCRFTENKQFYVGYYDSQAVSDRNGQFCYPKDEELKKTLLTNSGLLDREHFMKSFDTIKICLGLSVLLSISYLIIVQCIPKQMNYITIGAGVLVMVTLVVCLALYPTEYVKTKWFLFILLTFFIVIVIFGVIFNRPSWKAHQIFLKQASEMVNDNWSILFYLAIFIPILAVFLLFFVVFQFKAFWASGQPTFNAQQSLYYKVTGLGRVLLTFLWFIQCIWGFAFLKQSFNFCVSGMAVRWYYEEKPDSIVQPLKVYLCKHLGSVIGGSFMTGFLSIFDIIGDFLKPDFRTGEPGCYNNCCSIFKPLLQILQLVRSDAMAFIYITGNPYCNSARYCQYLCNQSVITEHTQTTSRSYRICAHFFLAGLLAIIALYINGQNKSLFIIFIIIIIGVFISTFFISLHADLAEAIQICFLTDEQFYKRGNEKSDPRYKFKVDELSQISKKPNISEQIKKIMVEKQKQKQPQKIVEQHLRP